MKPFAIMRRLILPAAILALLSLSMFAAHAQQASTITGSFVVSNVVFGKGPALAMSFDPNGGPVSFQTLEYEYDVFDDGACFATNVTTMSGTFAGGDGGVASGPIHSVITLDKAKSQSSCQGNAMDFAGTWQGKLYANGTGSGTASLTWQDTTWSGDWEATYSAQEFQAALGAAVPPTSEAAQPTVVTEEPLPTEQPLATAEPLATGPALEQPSEAAPSNEQPSGALSTIAGLGFMGAGAVAALGGLGVLSYTVLTGGPRVSWSAKGGPEADPTPPGDAANDVPGPPLQDPASEFKKYPVPRYSHVRIAKNLSLDLPPRVAGLFTRNAWNRLPEKERRQAVKYVIWAMGKQLGLGQKVNVVWPKDGEKFPYAGQAFAENVPADAGIKANPPVIKINDGDPNTWTYPESVLATLGHEMRHLQQYLPQVPLETSDLKKLVNWNKDAAHYIAPKDDLSGSYDQFIERDANSMGKQTAIEVGKQAYREKLGEVGEFFKSTMEVPSSNAGGAGPSATPREVHSSQLDDILEKRPDYRERIAQLVREGKLKVVD